ncbi:hypothetical protein [Rhizobium sp. L43]|uniref:hypothetical protein n=1 Tax=Rhizobium sp. L43 TaxID=2035452 RepID=UPI000BE98262|nr:hypothetical protein [Rhizobium sp. L43]PDS75460.1 hypothetical protein CO667_26625 [Rhizobium sp. L43]
MQIADIFETTPTQATAPATLVARSELIERPSKHTQRNVRYVRLCDAEHAELLSYVSAMNIMRTDKSDPTSFITLNNILDRSSGIWGSRLRKFSTLREVLDGVTEKLARAHKWVKGRRGEDLSVEQLTAINVIITAMGCTCIAIPAKEA